MARRRRCSSALLGGRLGHIVRLLFVAVIFAVLCAPSWATMGGRHHVPRPTTLRMPHLQPRSSKTSPTLYTSSKTPPLKIKDEKNVSLHALSRLVGGGSAISGNNNDKNNLENTVTAIVKIFWSSCKMVLPPTVAVMRAINGFYRALPTDAITAQIGLVYCFAGGYYPTLFSALQAARQCGWETMVQAIDDLTDQARAAIDAASKQSIHKATSLADSLTETTMTVLKAIDPVIINTAAGALYTTWLGVSTVLEREFAKTLALSMSIAGYMQPMARFILEPPLFMAVPDDYHQWVPVLVGWVCKAAAMSVAWRIQRVFTCYTSAITGGLMFSRAVMRMLHKRGIRWFGIVPEDDHESPLDEVFGLAIAGVGMYSQMGSGFDFTVPWPLTLVLWPFDWAEKWIEWQITKDAR